MHKTIQDYDISHHDLYVRRNHKIELWTLILGVLGMAFVILAWIFISWIFSLFTESFKLLN